MENTQDALHSATTAADSSRVSEEKLFKYSVRRNLQRSSGWTARTSGLSQAHYSRHYPNGSWPLPGWGTDRLTRKLFQCLTTLTTHNAHVRRNPRLRLCAISSRSAIRTGERRAEPHLVTPADLPTPTRGNPRRSALTARVQLRHQFRCTRFSRFYLVRHLIAHTLTHSPPPLPASPRSRPPSPALPPQPLTARLPRTPRPANMALALVAERCRRCLRALQRPWVRAGRGAAGGRVREEDRRSRAAVRWGGGGRWAAARGGRHGAWPLLWRSTSRKHTRPPALQLLTGGFQHGCPAGWFGVWCPSLLPPAVQTALSCAARAFPSHLPSLQ